MYSTFLADCFKHAEADVFIKNLNEFFNLVHCVIKVLYSRFYNVNILNVRRTCFLVAFFRLLRWKYLPGKIGRAHNSKNKTKEEGSCQLNHLL